MMLILKAASMATGKLCAGALHFLCHVYHVFKANEGKEHDRSTQYYWPPGAEISKLFDRRRSSVVANLQSNASLMLELVFSRKRASRTRCFEMPPSSQFNLGIIIV